MAHPPLHPTNGPSGDGYRPPANGSALYPEALTSATGGMQLRQLLGTLWRGKWIILASFVLVLGAAAAYTYSIAPKYRTATLLMIKKESDTALPLFGSGNRSSAFGYQSSKVPNELFVLRNSQVIAQRVAARIDSLARLPRYEGVFSIVRNAETGKRYAEGAIAARLGGFVSAGAASQEVDAISISATSTRPREAAWIANLYALEYIERTKEKSREKLQASRRFLETQADRFKQRVERAEAKIEAYMRREGAVALDQETQRTVSRIAELEARRDQLRIELNMKQQAIERQKRELASIEPKLIEQVASSVPAQLNTVQTQKAQLQTQLDAVQRRHTKPFAPAIRTEVQRLRERIQNLQAQADSLARVYVNESLAAGGIPSSAASGGGGGVSFVAQQREQLAQLRIEVSGLQAQLQSVQDELVEARQTLERIPAQSIELAQLQRERRSAESMYSFIRQKLQEARIAEQSEVGYAEVVRPAGVPYAPVAPDTKKNLLFGALLGLLLGGGLVVLRDQLDNRVHQPDDLEAQGHRVLGVVPTMDPMIADDFDGQSHVQVNGTSIDTTLAMLVSPMSSVAESYRRIRANLQFARPDANVEVINVTSSGKGEGKTTTAVNLAVALASAGKRTLIIDADLRRPRLHKLLGLEREPGLSHLLYDEGQPVERFETSIDHLYAVPAGETVPNPSELLGSQRMRHFIEAMRPQFDVVIFDTPPVLLFSDALALSAHCDGTMLVVGADDTDQRAVDHALQRIREVDGSVLGCVLNRFTASNFFDSTNYGYGYSYGYHELTNYYNEATTGTRLRDWLRG
ncbi:polysaccharide biosynthesis tyrosine autokinase [Salisaeta longa]|uniref:polysaccharide biosynthesis tyrosine autokinase n=1 Tax=Salisaeta longa TaxID=503170 RepID=UPI0003B40D31|nr:polysaccharide biosynthesis tyrosine autokinase [Salisaeta longa]